MDDGKQASAHSVSPRKSYQILDDERQKLWRRIWWVLFINDIHHAAVFGRPPHIHSQYTDVEPLTPSDMATSDSTHANTEESHLFLVEYCRLATLVDRCLLEKYCATSSPQRKNEAWRALREISSTRLFFNVSIDSASSLTTEKGFYSAVLSLIHLDYSVVVERMLSSDIHVPAPDRMQSYFRSAGSICRILEDLLSSPSALVTRLPYVAFPAIFCSILIHIIYLRKESGSIRLVAESRARLAMAVLDQLQDRWPLVVWTHYLLDMLLKNTESPAPSSSDHALHNLRHRSPERAHRPWTEDDGTGGLAPLPPEREHAVSSIRSTNPTANLADAHPNSRDHFGLNTGMDGTFSPIPFMLPWNSLLEDFTELDQWLL